MMKLLNFDLNKIINTVYFAANALADFVFPKTCIICGKTVAAGHNISLCEKCKINVELNDFGMFLKDLGECDYIISGVKYVDTVRQKMIMYKFKNCKYLSHSFAYLAQCALKKSNILNDYSDCVIIPMPVHITRDRLYNQSALIAYDVAKHFNAQYCDDAVCKAAAIKPLSKMHKNEKKIFIQNSFEVCRPHKIAGKTVIITDDIYTTGATINECARVVKNSGAKTVIGITPCYTPKK